MIAREAKEQAAHEELVELGKWVSFQSLEQTRKALFGSMQVEMLVSKKLILRDNKIDIVKFESENWNGRNGSNERNSNMISWQPD